MLSIAYILTSMHIYKKSHHHVHTCLSRPRLTIDIVVPEWDVSEGAVIPQWLHRGDWGGRSCLRVILGHLSTRDSVRWRWRRELQLELSHRVRRAARAGDH